MIEASTNKKTLDFRGFPVDLNIQKDSELNIVFIIYYSHTPMREQQVLYFISSQSTLL